MKSLNPFVISCLWLNLRNIIFLGLKGGKDVDRALLISTAKNIEEMSVSPTANRKQVTQKSLSLLNYLNIHTSLVRNDKELRLALQSSCWVVPEPNPSSRKLFNVRNFRLKQGYIENKLLIMCQSF